MALLIGLALLVAGTPGLSTWGPDSLKSDAQRAQARERQGPVIGALAIATADLNRWLRVPIASRLVPVQRLFRIRQSWGLYGGGPRKVMRLELYVDDRLVYRTRDPDHAWLAPQLQSRKVRPMVESTAKKATAFNWKGLGRFLVARARADFPDAREVRIVATRGDLGHPQSRVSHGRLARAPTWELQELGDNGQLLPDDGADGDR